MDVLEAIRTRRSVRKYRDQPIPEATVNQVLEALRLAPSGCNFQPWKFLAVRDASLKLGLVEACHGQSFIAQAPVVIVGCGWEEKSYQRMGEWGTSLVVDVTIALDHLTLAAAAEGLGTCWIGAFNEEKVRSVLSIPKKVRVVALTPLGYPDEVPPPRPRKALHEIVQENCWKD